MRESAGGIIKNLNGRIVLVEQHSNSWSFPKGGVETGETAREAAVREIKEETGITQLEYIQDLGSYERYSIGPDGVSEYKDWGLQKKTFFLFTTAQTELVPHDNEITQARWVTLDEAYALLTHPKDKEFLKSIWHILEQ